MTNNFPNLSDDFFAVCQTAIKAAAWKYEDFGRVKSVEGELERLRSFFNSLNILKVPAENTTTTLEIPAGTGQVSTTAPEVGKDVIPETPSVLEAPSALKPEKNGILTPDQAKEAPIRPMPDDIRQIVEAGIEVAKNPPKVREVKVEELPSDPDEARNAFNKPF